jgi:hypothetical protein
MGEGVLRDYKEAAKWYLLAAKQDYSIAQSSLGGLYRFGQGVPKDIVRAHMWYNIAAAGDAIFARDQITEIEKEMVSTQITRATDMAHACMKSGYLNC